MFAIVGLGNPEKTHYYTRHNIGFRIVDEFGDKNNFPGFRVSKKHGSLISEGILGGKKITLAKPQTYMNESGKAARKIIGNRKSEIGNLFIVHDDIDLLLGKMRIARNRSSAGHKGVESIIRELKTKNFVRFRIGIKPASGFLTSLGKPKNVDKFVLQKFGREEEMAVKGVIEKAAEAIECAIEQGIEKSMANYNK